MEPLVVAKSFVITGRGPAVFFERQPVPWLPWCRHRVAIETGGAVRETVGMVEFARVQPGIEVQTLVFPELEHVPVGTRIRVLSAVDG